MTDNRKSARERGYTRAWEKARAAYLRKHPLCAYCKQQGHVIPATVVDHIKAHKGDRALFWDSSNWQALCKRHHDSTKQAEERAGKVLGADLDGQPLDPAHHWNL